MRIGVRLLSGVMGVVLVGAVASHHVWGQSARPTIATEADFRRAMKELSNWGRWGELDELGAANLITPAKRKQALALAREGRAISLAHDVPQEKAVDTPTFLDRAVVTVGSDGGAGPVPVHGHLPWRDSQSSRRRGLSHHGGRAEATTACRWRRSRPPAAALEAASTR